MASSIVVGVANGLLDTGASTLCLQLWGKDSGPYMQALHFSFAVGGSIAPLLVQAFIVETTAPNNTMSSRHVRSVTFPLSSSESDEQMSTLVSTIIQAVSQPPPFLPGSSSTASTSNLTIASSNSTIVAPNSTTSNSTSTFTTSSPATLNQTAPVTEKPKKPKPVVINGQAFGDSSQFDHIPLKIETLPPQEVVATTTVASSENRTTPIITAGNDTIDPSENVTFMKAQDSNVTNITISTTPKGLEELNVNTSAIGSDIKNESAPLSTSQVTGNNTFLSSTIPSSSTEVSVVTSAPVFSEKLLTNLSKSDTPSEPQPETILSIATKGN